MWRENNKTQIEITRQTIIIILGVRQREMRLGENEVPESEGERERDCNIYHHKVIRCHKLRERVRDGQTDNASDRLAGFKVPQHRQTDRQTIKTYFNCLVICN